MIERHKALNDGEWYDFSMNKNPKCPHCGSDFIIREEEEEEAWFLYDDSQSHTVECSSCDQEFQVSAWADWKFSTDEQEDEP